MPMGLFFAVTGAREVVMGRCNEIGYVGEYGDRLEDRLRYGRR